MRRRPCTSLQTAGATPQSTSHVTLPPTSVISTDASSAFVIASMQPGKIRHCSPVHSWMYQAGRSPHPGQRSTWGSLRAFKTSKQGCHGNVNNGMVLLECRFGLTDEAELNPGGLLQAEVKRSKPLRLKYISHDEINVVTAPKKPSDNSVAF